MKLLVTGAAGFIGSNLVHFLRRERPDMDLVSFDALTYSGNLANLADVLDDPQHRFVHGDITDRAAVRDAFTQFRPDGVIHLAAESHVDRSIVEPMAFVRTNVEGTAVLLQEATAAWRGHGDVRFLHVSTDEVFGSLGSEGKFSESTPYAPRSPYSASKAASDHLVRAWGATHDLPFVITNCSNNYGPYQFPEKLIPLVITKALDGQPVPVYGRGENVRDWLHVEDHCEALLAAFERAATGTTLCIGGDAEVRNIDLVGMVLDQVDVARGRQPGESRELIRFVEDRPGHDLRYAMDTTRIRRELGWQPRVDLADGLRRTVRWYLDNAAWCDLVRTGAYRDFEATWYGERLRRSHGSE